MSIGLLFFLGILIITFFIMKIGDVFSPWFLTTAIWFAILFLFLFDNILDPLGPQFYTSVWIWVPIFCASSMLTYYALPASTKQDERAESIEFNSAVFHVLFYLSLVMTPFYLYRIMQTIMMFDSALTRLERFVSEEQHKLATQLKRNYAILKERAEKHYREAQQRYTEYMDSHRETSLSSETIEEKSLEKEYDKAYDAYRQSCLQYLRADALTNKPVIPFAVVKNATVQQEASSPIFMGYLLSFMAIAFIASSWFILLRKKYHIWKGGVSS